MVSWDDLAVELEKTSKALEKTKLAFESLIETYQALIDYCEEWKRKLNLYKKEL